MKCRSKVFNGDYKVKISNYANGFDFGEGGFSLMSVCGVPHPRVSVDVMKCLYRIDVHILCRLLIEISA